VFDEQATPYFHSPVQARGSPLQLERGGITPTAKALTPEQQTIQEFQARINRLELEKKILKEATALLMAEAHGRRR